MATRPGHYVLSGMMKAETLTEVCLCDPEDRFRRAASPDRTSYPVQRGEVTEPGLTLHEYRNGSVRADAITGVGTPTQTHQTL